MKSKEGAGKHRKEGSADAIPCILEPQGDEKTFRRNWARLIQKIYETDPLVCLNYARKGHRDG